MKLKIIIALLGIISLGPNIVYAQDSTAKTKENIDLMFYVDTYNCYDFNDPYSGYRTPLVYNYNRHNEFNINLALLNFKYSNEKIEANFGLNVGSFPNVYYSKADTLYRYLYQANIKYKLSNKLDIAAGMFAPHMGFESIMSYDNMTVSQSLVSEGTPYYILGVKSYYHFSKQFELGLIIANGWQNIQRAPGTNQLGYGLHLHYLTEDGIEISFANYSYNDETDNTDWTFYNEIFAQKQLSKKLRLLSGISFALVPNNNHITIATVVSQYKLSKTCSFALRAEYVDDKSRAFYTTANTKNPIEISAFSANFDYNPVENLKLRIEGRYFSSSNKAFLNDENMEITQDGNNFLNNSANILLSAQLKIN